MTTSRWRELVRPGRALVLPCAHDALSARLIEQAGFDAYSIGGFGLIASRMGLPDVGLASFGEISAAVRDISAASSLPVLVDGDDGYGDVKNVTRTVQVYESMGIAGLVLEDQTSPKRCGHMAGKDVVALDAALRKLEAALAARRTSDLFVIARTDARGVNGLDDALERGRRFLAAGADALFIEAPQSIDELELIGRSFDKPLLVNMAEAGRTPILAPSRLAEMGYSMVVYPATLFVRSILAMQGALDDLRRGELRTPADMPTFSQLTAIVGLRQWDAIEDRFGTPRRDPA